MDSWIFGSKMEYLKQIKKELDNGNESKFLSLWEEYCLGDELDPIECRLILEAIKNSEYKKAIGTHIDNILPLWEKLEPSVDAEEVFSLVFDLQTHNEKSLGKIGLNYLKKITGTILTLIKKFV